VQKIFHNSYAAATRWFRGPGACPQLLQIAPVRRLLLFYYLSTPAFAALDLLLGVNVRTVFFDGSPWRFVYYAASLGCGVVGWRRPALAPLVGMAESGLSIALLIIGIYVPIWEATEALGSEVAVDFAVSPVLTLRGIVNVALSGASFLLGFYGNQAAFLATRRGRTAL